MGACPGGGCAGAAHRKALDVGHSGGAGRVHLSEAVQVEPRRTVRTTARQLKPERWECGGVIVCLAHGLTRRQAHRLEAVSKYNVCDLSL